MSVAPALDRVVLIAPISSPLRATVRTLRRCHEKPTRESSWRSTVWPRIIRFRRPSTMREASLLPRSTKLGPSHASKLKARPGGGTGDVLPVGSAPPGATLLGRTVLVSSLVDLMDVIPCPHRHGNITALDEGQVQSRWVSEQFGRKVIKEWNAINTGSFDSKATPVGHPDRFATPVAGDGDAQRDLAMSLVQEIGFDAFDAGNLEQSWRQQPGTPVFCTDFIE